ncbi:MAG: hydrogenase expression/formation protein [Gammaproteobacteria bacterium]|nr:hydrogenase expression/formation protein [Gammaproteobacteria bacterium]
MISDSLADINVHVENLHHDFETGNLHSILSEIKFALEQLLQHKKTHSIDLRAMPWSPGEEKKLEQYLGKGEIQIEMDALGKSHFYESKYSGIWIVTHYNPEGEVIGKLIEISYMPDMIFTREEDVKDSLERLQQL